MCPRSVQHVAFLLVGDQFGDFTCCQSEVVVLQTALGSAVWPVRFFSNHLVSCDVTAVFPVDFHVARREKHDG